MSDQSLPVPAVARGGALRALFRGRSTGHAPTPVKLRQIRRGAVGSLLAPVGMAAGIVIVMVVAASVGTNWWLGFTRDAEFSRPVQPDGTVARVGGGAALSENVTILASDQDGNLVRRVAGREDADRHVNEAIARLDAARTVARARADEEIERLFALAFADRDAAIAAYADWFFQWKRPYVVLKEAVVSTTSRLVEIGEYEPLATAVERDLKEYFIRHYSEQVLRPGIRDPLISGGFEDIARRAHEGWQRAVVEEDLRLQLFLAERTDTFASADEGRLTEITLDWRSQAFKAPTPLMEDAAFDGMVSLAAIGIGGTLGAYGLGPVVERAMSRTLSGLGSRYAAAFGGRVAIAEAGALAGTAVQPVTGTVVGAVAGGVLGLALDYLVNEASEAINRETFVEANEAALDSTVEAWKSTLRGSVHGAIDRWFDDSRAALVELR